MNNAHMYQMFDEWRKEKIDFQMHRIILFTKVVRALFWIGDEQNEIVFKQMKKYKEDYPLTIFML